MVAQVLSNKTHVRSIFNRISASEWRISMIMGTLKKMTIGAFRCYGLQKMNTFQSMFTIISSIFFVRTLNLYSTKKSYHTVAKIKIGFERKICLKGNESIHKTRSFLNCLNNPNTTVIVDLKTLYWWSQDKRKHVFFRPQRNLELDQICAFPNSCVFQVWLWS